MRPSRRSAVLTALLLALSGAAALGWTWWPAGSCGPNFGIVEPGRIYRSGQPSPANLEQIRRLHGLKTVVNLRGLDADTDVKPEEQWCRREGVRLVTVGVTHHDMTPAQAEQILCVLGDPACQPVLVHCHAGQRRTGMVVATYRMLAQGRSLEQARAEMLGYIRHPESVRCDEFLRTVASGEISRPRSR